jgi:hypothetical protein
MSEIEHTQSTRPNAGVTWLQAGALGTAASVVASLAVFGIARAADASMVVVDAGSPHEVTTGSVTVSAAAPVIVGTVLAALVALRWFTVVRVAQIVGGGFGLVSVAGPLSADTDGGTAAALAAMHVVVAAAYVIGLEVARRRLSAAGREGRTEQPVPAGSASTADALR